ncbi:glycerate kinase [Paraflavisolibacter sp. H34]|uniref:glycerate kinase n=1 Tax=Huijunlia imazamoxiresistens TaxID=3127457 RepID=UPI0030159E5B
MRIVIAPDKFKGSLTSFEVCRFLAEGVRSVADADGLGQFPLADGGDGFGPVLQHYLQTETVACATADPLGRPLQASYQWSPASRTAFIESAAASGLALLAQGERDPMVTSTFGTGLLVKAALEKGAEKIILGLGGSATNDGGTGILAALGFKLLDGAGQELPPCGRSLLALERLVPPPGLRPVPMELACDVQNPLYGPDGAAFVYGPQKGASPEAVRQLDEGLRRWAEVLRRQTGTDVAHLPGAGAAGGMAAGLLAFFPVVLRKGIDLVVAASGLEARLATADLLITGEGCIDAQSLQGKVVGRIAELGRQRGIPVIAFCGQNQLSAGAAARAGLQFVFPLVNEFVSPEDAIRNAGPLLRCAVVSSVLFLKKKGGP